MPRRPRCQRHAFPIYQTRWASLAHSLGSQVQHSSLPVERTSRMRHRGAAVRKPGTMLPTCCRRPTPSGGRDSNCHVRWRTVFRSRRKPDSFALEGARKRKMWRTFSFSNGTENNLRTNRWPRCRHLRVARRVSRLAQRSFLLADNPDPIQSLDRRATTSGCSI
jgi:hypothetical protein